LYRVGREELAAAQTALPMYLRDSRMGHLNHGRGCFTAMTIAEKIERLKKTLKTLRLMELMSHFNGHKNGVTQFDLTEKP
jgi:hypothetical protein